MKVPLLALVLSQFLGFGIATDIFFTTKDYTYQREIQAPYETVLKIVRDPVVFSSHSLLFKSIERDTSTAEPDWYTITERLPLLGPIESSLTFRAKLVPLENGLDADVDAALGTALKSVYTVERGDVGKSVVKELTTVKVSSSLPRISELNVRSVGTHHCFLLRLR
jgi:hypothetical protein